MTYHTEKIETAIAKIHECLDAPIDPVRVRRLLKDIGKWSAEAEREAYARGKAEADKLRAAGAPSDEEILQTFSEACEYADRCGQGFSYGRAQALRAVISRYSAPQASAEQDRIRQLETEVSSLRAARMAYAREFPLNADGEPDVGNIHANIRAMKSALAAVDSAKGAGDVGECNFTDLIDAYTDAVLNGNFSERVAARAELMNSYRQQRGGDTDAAVAAIRFALEADDGMAWLRCWNEGDFDACRNEWPETPEECFIGADPLHPSTQAALATHKPDGGEAKDAEPMPEIMRRPDALRGYADTCEYQARCTSHGTLYSTAEALRKIADWCETHAAQQRQGEGGGND